MTSIFPASLPKPASACEEPHSSNQHPVPCILLHHHSEATTGQTCRLVSPWRGQEAGLRPAHKGERALLAMGGCQRWKEQSSSPWLSPFVWDIRLPPSLGPRPFYLVSRCQLCPWLICSPVVVLSICYFHILVKPQDLPGLQLCHCRPLAKLNTRMTTVCALSPEQLRTITQQRAVPSLVLNHRH